MVSGCYGGCWIGTRWCSSTCWIYIYIHPFPLFIIFPFKGSKVHARWLAIPPPPPPTLSTLPPPRAPTPDHSPRCPDCGLPLKSTAFNRLQSPREYKSFSVTFVPRTSSSFKFGQVMLAVVNASSATAAQLYKSSTSKLFKTVNSCRTPAEEIAVSATLSSTNVALCTFK